jgi:hypothetical protein
MPELSNVCLVKVEIGFNASSPGTYFRSNLVLEALRLTGRGLAGTSPRPLGFGG